MLEQAGVPPGNRELLGTREWFVIHHTDCGMLTFTDETMRRLLASSLEPAILGEKGWEDTGGSSGSNEGEFIDWLTIGDLEESVGSDVSRIRHHPLVPPEISIYGYIYDVKTGRLNEVARATNSGKAAL